MTVRPSIFEANILAFDVTCFAQTLLKCSHVPRVRHRGRRTKNTNHGHRGLLCARRQRPRRSATDERDELAPSHGLPAHSITSSARASSVGGMSRPSALAVLRLIIVWNFVARSTGRSVGLVPFKILSTNVAARRYMSGKFTP